MTDFIFRLFFGDMRNFAKKYKANPFLMSAKIGLAFFMLAGILIGSRWLLLIFGPKTQEAPSQSIGNNSASNYMAGRDINIYQGASKFGTTTTIRLSQQIDIAGLATLTAVPPVEAMKNNDWDPGYEIALSLAPVQIYSQIPWQKTGTSSYTISVPFTVPSDTSPNSYDFKRDAFHNSNNILIGNKVFTVILKKTEAMGGINKLNYFYTFSIQEQ